MIIMGQNKEIDDFLGLFVLYCAGKILLYERQRRRRVVDGEGGD